MSNNPFNVLNPANPMNANRVGQMKNMMQTFRNAKNPMALFQQMAMSNPQLRPIMNMINQGKNPNQILEDICKQRSINPQELMNILKG